MDTTYTFVLALAALAGFVFEWRRDTRREEEDTRTRQRVASLEERVAEVEQWRERISRAQ